MANSKKPKNRKGNSLSKRDQTAQPVRIRHRKNRRQRTAVEAVSDVVPTNNVLDLRSIIARQEAEQRRKEQEQHEGEQSANKKKNSLFPFFLLLKRTRKKRSTLSAQSQGVPVVQERNGYAEELLQSLESSDELQDNSLSFSKSVSEEEFAFWNEEQQNQADNFAFVQPLQHQTQREGSTTREQKWRQKKDHAKREFAQKEHKSFFERPLQNENFDQLITDRAHLPVVGFSFRTVVIPLCAFIVFSILFVLPASVYATLSQSGNQLEETVTASAEEAFEHLKNGGESIQDFDFETAESEFSHALKSFQIAESEIANLNEFVVSITQYVPGKGQEFTAGTHLLAAGEELAAAGEQLSKAMGVLSKINVGTLTQNEDNGLTSLLVVVHSGLSPSVAHINRALTELDQVSIDQVPEDKKELVQFAKNALPSIQYTLEDGVAMTEMLLSFLGHEESKRYLVLFQNNHEIRPTGGFVGSLAIVDIEEGIVTGFEAPGGGVYDIAGQLTQTVISPTPLHLVNAHWNIQDANWFPHYPTSAQKIQSFYINSKGSSVDGVIALVPSVIERFLEITGPIDMTEKYGVVITAENFYDEVQSRAEEKFDVNPESKRIIGDMTPMLLNKVFHVVEEPEGLVSIVALLREILVEKDLLVYMNDPVLQSEFSKRDWSGELKNTDRDYLAVIHANIAGGKTSDVMQNIVKHTAEIQEEGSIINTVTLTTQHKGSSEDDLRNVLNRDFVRFYVPEGSELLSSEGFNTPDARLFLHPDPEYTYDEDLKAISGDVLVNEQTGVYTNTEFGKTVFGGWIQTLPGESSAVTIRYRLPFTINTTGFWNSIDRYSLLYQKQPGSFGDFLLSEVVIPKTMNVVRSYPAEYEGTVQTIVSEDVFVGLLVESAD